MLISKLTIIIGISILVISCNSLKKANKTIETNSIIETNETNKTIIEKPIPADIPYVLAKNYFVRNSYSDSIIHFITLNSDSEFYRIFGMAPLMGENGKPTPIDFSKQFVIACIDKISEKKVVLELNSLQSFENKILFKCNYSEGEIETYKKRMHLLLIVDKKYQSEINLILN